MSVSRGTAWRLAVTIAAVIAGTAGATVTLAIGFDQMAAEADRVIVGTVGSASPRWSADGSIIETVVEIAVEQDLSGASGEPVVAIVQPGGRIGETGYMVTGYPSFEPGERVLVFLRSRGNDGFGRPAHAVVGMAQGKFLVYPKLGGGWTAIQQFPNGFSLASADADGSIRVDGTLRPLAIDLDEAIERIRAIRGLVTP